MKRDQKATKGLDDDLIAGGVIADNPNWYLPAAYHRSNQASRKEPGIRRVAGQTGRCALAWTKVATYLMSQAPGAGAFLAGMTSPRLQACRYCSPDRPNHRSEVPDRSTHTHLSTPATS